MWGQEPEPGFRPTLPAPTRATSSSIILGTGTAEALAPTYPRQIICITWCTGMKVT